MFVMLIILICSPSDDVNGNGCGGVGVYGVNGDDGGGGGGFWLHRAPP